MAASVLGQAFLPSGESDFNAISFIVEQILSGANYAGLVQVTAVNGNTVSVQPLVNQIDGLGNATAHGIVNGLIWFQLQGGANAIEIAPAVGDIGVAVFADRDISSVVANKAAANPGSFRRFSMSDGIYFGGIKGLCPTPTQYIQFTDSGITITTPNAVAINSASLTHNGVNIGATHKHPYIPGTGTQTETGAPNE